MSAAVQAVNGATGWQAGFLTLLPAVRTHARIQFRNLPAGPREEATQETVAAACVSYQRLAIRGRLHAARPGTVAAFAVKFVRSGRHVGGRQDSARDVMSPVARRRHGVRVVRCDGDSTEPCGGDGWTKLLVARRTDSIPDVVAFRIDFDHWLGTLTRREGDIIAALASGECTSAVADRFGISWGRVSQLRRGFEQAWKLFQGEQSVGTERRTNARARSRAAAGPAVAAQHKAARA